MIYKIILNATIAKSDTFKSLALDHVRMEYWDGVPAEKMKYLTTEDRTIFFPIYLLIYVVSFFANIFAIYITVKRKHRSIQKTFTISLSLSDIITATAYSVNNIETFSHPLVNWTLGSFICDFIPFAQTFGILASSVALVAIALDRYRNVAHILHKKWNPSLSICLVEVFVVWIVCAGIAYPMFEFFDSKQVIALYTDNTGKINDYEKMHLCISDKKETMKIYYISISLIVFLPLITIFFWLYYNVAKLIWTHRKPFTYNQHDNDNNTNETSTTQTKLSEETSKVSKVSPSVKPVSQPKKKSLNVERKIRTFKIIITLMITFIGCRLPYYIFNIEKLINLHNEHEYWIMLYIFNALALLNCALNPFLYTFLHPTLNVLKKISKTVNDFMCQVCCCWFSNAEFENFEKENPFIVENYEKMVQTVPIKKNSRVKFDEVSKEIPIINVQNDIHKEVNKY